jgi:hypothetical protein
MEKMKKIIQTAMFLCLVTNINAQKLLIVDVMSNLKQLAKGENLNLMCHIQSPHFPKIGLTGGYEYELRNRQINRFQYQEQSKSIVGQIRFYPFEERTTENDSDCYDFGNEKYNFSKLLSRGLKGLYLASGFEKQEVQIDYIPQKEVEAPKDKYTFKVTKNAISLAAGCLLRIKIFTLDLGYEASASKPKVIGDSAILSDKDFLNKTFPINFRLEQSMRIRVGISLK